MATSTQISMMQYMRTSYRPDREYIDGELVERNVGKWEHARVQAVLAAWFVEREKLWGIQVATEWRTQVSATRVRIPDLVLVKQGPQSDVLSDPPILLVEILAPNDSYADIQRRADDYRRMGARTLWIIDPQTRTGKVCMDCTWTETRRLTVEGKEIYEDLAPFCQDCASPTQNEFAGRSRRDAISALSQKDGESVVALKPAYLLTDGWLGAVHLLSRPREVFTFVDSDQIFEMAKLYRF